MPLIEKYANENNRVVTGVTADFGMGPDGGARGGLILEQSLVGNVTPSREKFSYYPMGLVTATFQWTAPQIVVIRDDNGTTIDSHWSENTTWIVGYQVTIWADTGEIKAQGTMCVR